MFGSVMTTRLKRQQVPNVLVVLPGFCEGLDRTVADAQARRAICSFSSRWQAANAEPKYRIE
jgi:hypothetical protein